MKKIGLLLLVFMTLLLSACDTGGPPASPATTTPASAPTSPALATKGPTRGAVATPLPPGEWYLVDSSEGGFSVQMPVKPQEGTSPIKDKSGKTIDLHTFVASKTSAEYTMTYADYPDEVAQQGAETLLNNTLTGALGKNKAISKKDVNVGGSPGMEVEFIDAASNNYAWYKLVARDARIYQLIVVATSKDSPDADAQRFFDSLTLTRATSESTPEPTAGLATRTTDDSGGEWQTYTSPDSKFSVEMPGQPQEASQTVDAGTGPVELHTLSFGTNKGAYTVIYADLPAASLQSGAGPVLEGALKGVAGQNAVQNKDNITLQGNPGIAGEFEAQGTGYTRYAAILVEDRLYQLITITQDKNTGAEAVQRFFSSFKLTQ